MEESRNVIITGVGGQGNVLAARLLAAVALDEGYEATVGDVYGLTQRGGSVASHVRWTRGLPLPPLVPQQALDILVGFEPLEALRILTQFGKEDSVAIVNEVPIMPIGVQTGRFKYPDHGELRDGLRRLTKKLSLVNATEIAQNLGNVQALNIVMMGALFGAGFISLKAEGFEKAIETQVPKRFVSLNLTAFREGMIPAKAAPQ